MKRQLCVFFALIGLALTAQNMPIPRLEWDDPNPVGSVQEYRIVRIAGSTVTRVATVTECQWAIQGLPIGWNTIGVVAIGTNSVSADAATIDIGVLIAVTNLRVTTP